MAKGGGGARGTSGNNPYANMPNYSGSKTPYRDELANLAVQQQMNMFKSPSEGGQGGGAYRMQQKQAAQLRPLVQTEIQQARDKLANPAPAKYVPSNLPKAYADYQW